MFKIIMKITFLNIVLYLSGCQTVTPQISVTFSADPPDAYIIDTSNGQNSQSYLPRTFFYNKNASTFPKDFPQTCAYIVYPKIVWSTGETIEPQRGSTCYEQSSYVYKKPTNNIQTSTQDDVTCKKYGFQQNTNGYASCRLQIDQARQTAASEQRRYFEQKRQYELQMAEYKRQQDDKKADAMLMLGLSLLAGGGGGGGGGGTNSIAPTPPLMPQIGPRTYILPGNKMMTCNTTGNITNCF